LLILAKLRQKKPQKITCCTPPAKDSARQKNVLNGDVCLSFLECAATPSRYGHAAGDLILCRLPYHRIAVQPPPTSLLLDPVTPAKGKVEFNNLMQWINCTNVKLLFPR
jgi:hypothetical protein